MTANTEILGKKIFFLYPSAVVQNRVTEELIQQEFEVYVLKDHIKMRKVLRRYPDSIVFINLFDGMSEKEWEGWIKSVQNEAGTAGAIIGIIGTIDDEFLRKKYVSDIRIRGGFTVIKSDLNIAMKQLFEILKTVDAKGRRKYIRAITENETNATVNFPRNGIFVKGAIKDISVVGLSCFFPEDPDFPKNSLHPDIQIKLQSTIIKAEGIVFGSRTDGNTKIYVVLFTQRIDPEARVRIRRYIQSNLQAKIDSE